MRGSTLRENRETLCACPGRAQRDSCEKGGDCDGAHEWSSLRCVRGYQGRLAPIGSRAAINEVVYQKNGMTVRAWPAIHLLDRPVSLGLEWNGLKEGADR